MSMGFLVKVIGERGPGGLCVARGGYTRAASRLGGLGIDTSRLG